MQIRAEEISQIIRKQIDGFDQKVAVSETGTVLEAGDGIARVYGLEAAMAGELLDFGHGGVVGLVLNLEEDNVGVALTGRVVNALGIPIDGKGPITVGPNETRKIEVKAPGIIARKSVH